MTWNRFGQYLDLLLSCILVVRLFRLGVYTKYRPFVVFVVFDSVQSLLYLVAAYFAAQKHEIIDYRLLWCSERLVAWIVTIWMVYATLIAILKQLPGILRFSLRFLHVTFGVALAIALFTVRPEYTAATAALDSDWKVRLTALAIVLERAFSFAELLAILSILCFILFFPVRVARNLAAFAAGLSIYLVLRISDLLTSSYLPGLYAHVSLDPGPFVLAGCLVYWILSLDAAGEESRVTLGRGWQSVPKEHLVRQLEAMNAALLRSGQSS